ncbi:MAG TPA: hypothetical protein VGB21_02510, partial [Candidatus Methylomirabilis sp.]
MPSAGQTVTVGYPEISGYPYLPGVQGSGLYQANLSGLKNNKPLLEWIAKVDNITDPNAIEAKLSDMIYHGMTGKFTYQGGGFPATLQSINWNPATVRNLMNAYSAKYNELMGRETSWKEQSKLGAGTGRRPTILTSGRGAQGTPAMALTKLKKQLGK